MKVKKDKGKLDAPYWATENAYKNGFEAGKKFATDNNDGDKVKVVRCKDCKHWHEETGWCGKHSHFVDCSGSFCYPDESIEWKMFDADYFCKDGERKDNG